MIYVLQKLYAKKRANISQENALYVVYGKEEGSFSAIHDVYEVGGVANYQEILNDWPIEIEVASVETTKSALNDLRRAKQKDMLPLVKTSSGVGG